MFKKYFSKLSPEIKVHLMILGTFLALWFYLSYAMFSSPALSGYDSVTRIYHADRLLVNMVGNVWLPFLQFFIRSINLLTENIFIFKLFSYTVSILAMLAYYFAVYVYFGRIVAVTSLAYFLMHTQWLGTATSIYMEPLFLLNISLACLFYYKNKNLLFSLFFLFASFTRPELLLAAPVILLGTLYWTKSITKTCYLGLLYLPITIFYLWLKLTNTDFVPPAVYSLEIAKSLLISMFEIYFSSRIFAIQGLMAIAGICLLSYQKVKSKNAPLLELISYGLVVYMLLYIFVIPIFHDFAGGHGSSRKSMYVLIPSYFYVGLCCQYLAEKFPGYVKYLFTILLCLAITYGYYQRDTRDFWPYRVAEDISTKVSKFYSQEYIHYICDFKDSHQDFAGFASVTIYPIQIYLRQLGWKFEVISCTDQKDRLWQILAKNPNRFVLRIYDPKDLKPEFYRKIISNTNFQGIVKSNGKERGKYCF